MHSGWEKIPPQYRSKLSSAALNHLDTFPEDFPDFELLPFGIGAHPDDAVSSPDNNWMTFAIGLLTPKSRGNVTIASLDPNDQPLVNPNFLNEQIDEEIAVQGVLRAREWALATGIIAREEDPGAEVTKEEDIKKWLREAGALVFHGSATNAMGKPDDPKAVLDAEARVYGVRGLRVVDASSAPLLGPGHPIATVCEYFSVFGVILSNI
jgi:choline dehydrogenase